MQINAGLRLLCFVFDLRMSGIKPPSNEPTNWNNYLLKLVVEWRSMSVARIEDETKTACKCLYIRSPPGLMCGMYGSRLFFDIWQDATKYVSLLQMNDTRQNGLRLRPPSFFREWRLNASHSSCKYSAFSYHWSKISHSSYHL